MRDSTKLSGYQYQEQIRSAMADYLPITASKVPSSQAPRLPIVVSGRVNIHHAHKRSNYFDSEIDVYSDTAIIRLPIMYFPNWQLYRNSSAKPYPFTYDNELGLIQVKLHRGNNVLQLWFENTPIRLIGNSLSLVSLATAIILLSL